MSERPVPATRAVVADRPGEPTTLALYNDDGGLASIVLGPTECITLASDLLNAARRRFSNLGSGGRDSVDFAGKQLDLALMPGRNIGSARGPLPAIQKPTFSTS
jgi:hypothetical protein